MTRRHEEERAGSQRGFMCKMENTYIVPVRKNGGKRLGQPVDRGTYLHVPAGAQEVTCPQRAQRLPTFDFSCQAESKDWLPSSEPATSHKSS